MKCRKLVNTFEKKESINFSSKNSSLICYYTHNTIELCCKPNMITFCGCTMKTTKLNKSVKKKEKKESILAK